MISAIDSSVLFSIFLGEASADDWIKELIFSAESGTVVICDVVAAEVGSQFSSFSEFSKNLNQLNITLDAINLESAYYAGSIFRRYRKLGGKREYLVPDFLIGAHAMKQADRLLAIDRGYLKRYFSGLKVVSI